MYTHVYVCMYRFIDSWICIYIIYIYIYIQIAGFRTGSGQPGSSWKGRKSPYMFCHMVF